MQSIDIVDIHDFLIDFTKFVSVGEHKIYLLPTNPDGVCFPLRRGIKGEDVKFSLEINTNFVLPILLQ